jgi:hypothetical protein
MFTKLTAIASITALLIFASPGLAQSPTSWANVGGLSCTMSPTIGLLVVEQQAVNCQFTPHGHYPSEHYTGGSERSELQSGSSPEACWRGPYTCPPKGRHKVRSPAPMAEPAAILI